jgi:hypothetical protein
MPDERRSAARRSADDDELKTLCQKADVPDQSGELLTQEKAA